MNYRLSQKAGRRGKTKENKRRAAKFRVGRLNELVLEFSATRRLYEPMRVFSQPGALLSPTILSLTGFRNGRGSASKKPCRVNVTDGAADVASSS
jgi:hypothetical protein